MRRSKQPFRPSRRAFLGGAGVVVALPFLESLLGKSAQADDTWPLRMLAYYVPCGIHMPAWTPSATGSVFTLPPILSPLVNVQQKLLVLTGLANAPARPDEIGDHASGTGSFLTCRHVYKTEGPEIQNGISVDQAAAAVLGQGTQVASLQLGIDGGGSIGDCDSGYSCAYARNISWASETQPLPKTVNPQVAFDLLFQGFDPEATEEELARFDEHFDAGALKVLSVDQVVHVKDSIGGTAPRRVREQITQLKKAIRL